MRKRGRLSNSVDCGSRSRRDSVSSQQTPLPPPLPPQVASPLPAQVPAPSASVSQSSTTPSPSDPIRLVIRLSKERETDAGGIDNRAGVGQIQENIGSTVGTSNEEEDQEFDEESSERESEHQLTGEPTQQFFVAPEAETFIDKNQARVSLVLNKALFAANGFDPGVGEADDDDDDEEEEGGGTVFTSANERPQRLPSMNSSQATAQQSVTVTAAATEQRYHSHRKPHTESQPSGYVCPINLLRPFCCSSLTRVI